MLYRNMKKTGDELSILGFGCMRLPQKKGSPGSGKIDEQRATRQIHYAIEQGVNYFDTAMPYHMGASEPFLGRALANGYREKIKLATKLPPWSVKTRQDMDQLLKVQLENLRTEYIDYYLVHALGKGSWQKMKNLGVLEFLDAVRAAGRIINAGFSFHGDKDTFKEIVDAYDWEFCQIQYNFLDQQNQAGTEGLKYAAAKDMGVIIMEPLRGGNLAGKVPPAVQAVWDEADIRRSAAEWSLRWIWNHPEVTLVLSGMNEEAHIDENLRIASEVYSDSLTDKELALVERVEQTYRSLMKAGCTGCRYCMPCPAGVDIPTCFEVYNKLHMFGDAKSAKLLYLTRVGGAMGAQPAYASLCENCGQCEDLCPQQLPIQDLLEDVAEEFEKWWLKPAVWSVKQIFAVHRWLTLRRARRLGRDS
jgi:predicted aldo/keto reductase-like oxidoreductase